MTKLPDLILGIHQKLFHTGAARPVTLRTALFSEDNITVDKDKFIAANDFHTAQVSFMSIIAGLLYPFHYKLYKEIFCSLLVMFCLLLTYEPLFSYISITTFNVLVISAVYLLFALYTKTIWHKNMYQYLQYKTVVDRNKFLFLFKPHGFLITLILGTSYIFTVVYGLAYISTKIYFLM